MATNKEVAKKEEQLPVDPSVFDGMETGFEGTSVETFKTPFLKILQALSPEMKKTDPSFIEGAQQGQFCNTATRELTDSVEVVVLKIEHVLVVWKPSRGGFVSRNPKGAEDRLVANREGMKKWDAEGNEIIDTIELFCLDINNPSNVFIFPLSKASVKHGRTFATRLRTLRINGKPVPTFAGVWRIRTMEDRNDKGAWFTIGGTPEYIRPITSDELNNCVIPAREMLKKAEIDYSAVAGDHAEEDENVKY